MMQRTEAGNPAHEKSSPDGELLKIGSTRIRNYWAGTLSGGGAVLGSCFIAS